MAARLIPMKRISILAISLACTVGSATTVRAATSLRIMPPDGGVLATGQRFDIRVEATSDTNDPPRGLRVLVNGRDITARNLLELGTGGERGAGGTGAFGADLPPMLRASPALRNTTNFLLRGYSVAAAGTLTIEARTADGASAISRLMVEDWSGAGRGPRARATSSCFSATAWVPRTAPRRESCREASTTAKPPAAWRWIRST